jgi:L-alanine-DL-glutamate epimerase-like enolase superfamily enzyme
MTPADAAIVAIECVPIALPLRRDWRWRGQERELGRWVIVRVKTDAAVEGLGEATPLADWGGDRGRMYGETPTTVCHIVGEYLAPALNGLSVWDGEEALRRMDGVVRGHVYAKAAVEMALFDACGRLAQQPVWRLLGGRARVSVPVAHMLGLMPIPEALAEADHAIGDGVRAFQVKSSGDLERDVELIRALRERTPAGTMLRLDANQGYRELDDKRAIAAVQQLEVAGIDAIEQPTEGLERMARIRGAARVPIVADESCWGPADVIDVARAGAADAISIYIAKAGGLRRARDVATLSALHGMPCDVNGSLESGVGNAASLHLATACAPITLPAVIPVTTVAADDHPVAAGRYYTDDIVTDSFRFADGALEATDAPGLGVTIDEEKLERYRCAL